MAYFPRFTISPRLLSLVETIASLRERIQGAAVELSWISALQKDTRSRNGHASTAIEGNPLTLEQVRALEEGRELDAELGHPLFRSVGVPDCWCDCFCFGGCPRLLAHDCSHRHPHARETGHTRLVPHVSFGASRSVGVLKQAHYTLRQP